MFGYNGSEVIKIRKIILILFLGIIVFGCSDSKKHIYYFNPPQWILGTWSNETYEFTFSEHDIAYQSTVEEYNLPLSFVFSTRYTSSNISELTTENEYWKHYHVSISNIAFIFGLNLEDGTLSYSYSQIPVLTPKGILTKH